MGLRKLSPAYHADPHVHLSAAGCCLLRRSLLLVSIEGGLLWHVQPIALTAARGGVGAVIWDGALVLTAYLAVQPPGSFRGASPARKPR